jgi:hypothetical protein
MAAGEQLFDRLCCVLLNDFNRRGRRGRGFIAMTDAIDHRDYRPIASRYDDMGIS